MGGPEAAPLLTFVVHVIGVVVLIWAIVAGQDERPDGRGWWRGDDGEDPAPVPDPPAPRGGGLPLPEAKQSLVRLREPGRIARHYELPERRPAREPRREPAPMR